MRPPELGTRSVDELVRAGEARTREAMRARREDEERRRLAERWERKHGK